MIFQLVQKYLSVLGISKAQSKRSVHVKVLIGCLLLGTNIILHLKFLFDEANSFKEYTESIFMSTVTVMSFWCYISMFYKREELFKFIDEGEKLLILFRESKYSKRKYYGKN